MEQVTVGVGHPRQGQASEPHIPGVGSDLGLDGGDAPIRNLDDHRALGPLSAQMGVLGPESSHRRPFSRDRCPR